MRGNQDKVTLKLWCNGGQQIIWEFSMGYDAKEAFAILIYK